jgi:hypothetical protein
VTGGVLRNALPALFRDLGYGRDAISRRKQVAPPRCRGLTFALPSNSRSQLSLLVARPMLEATRDRVPSSFTAAASEAATSRAACTLLSIVAGTGFRHLGQLMAHTVARDTRGKTLRARQQPARLDKCSFGV